MRPLAWALLAFVLSLGAQLVVWRLRRPVGHYMGLLALCAAVLAVLLGGLYALQAATSGSLGWLPRGPVEYANLAMLYVALILAYVTTYSAAQGGSPSLLILLRIERAGAAGVTREGLEGEFTDRLLVVPRLADLVTGGLVRQEGGRYVIAPRGRLMATVYVVYRALLGMGKGG